MAFLDKMKEYLDKGVEVSKDALSKAGDAVQDFSEKSVTKIETRQLQSRQNKEYRALGLAVYQFFEENSSGSLSSTDSRIAGFIQEIQRLTKEIERREEALKSESKDKASSTKNSEDTNSFSASSPDATSDEKDDVTDAEFTKMD